MSDESDFFACTIDESAGGLADDLEPNGENPEYGPGNQDWEHDMRREDRLGVLEPSWDDLHPTEEAA